jgi:two-component system OmpR family response regulator
MLRSTEISTPVIFLTTMGGIEDRVVGLESGADDYLIKPFAFSELIARVQALARRPPLSRSQTVLRVGDLEVDLLKRKVRRGADVIDLQAREFALLEFLMHRAGQVVTRTMLLEGVWNFHFDPKTNIVETHMSRLRSKVDKGRGPALIHTIRGSGYSIHAASESN